MRTLLRRTLPALLALAVVGVRLVSDADAVEAGIVNITSASGGTVQLLDGPNEVTNATSVPLSILDIQVNPGCSIEQPGNGGNGGNGGAIVQANGGGSFVDFCDDNPSTTVPPGDFCGLIIVCQEV